MIFIDGHPLPSYGHTGMSMALFIRRHMTDESNVTYLDLEGGVEPPTMEGLRALSDHILAPFDRARIAKGRIELRAACAKMCGYELRQYRHESISESK